MIRAWSTPGKVTIGSANELFIGHKHGSFVGIQTELNHSKKYEMTKSSVKAKAGTTYTITAANSAATSVFDSQGIKLNAGGTKIVISKDGGVVITAKGQVVVSSKTSAKIIAQSDIIVKAPKVTASSGIFETKNIKDLG